jgi:hypothetical protein
MFTFLLLRIFPLNPSIYHARLLSLCNEAAGDIRDMAVVCCLCMNSAFPLYMFIGFTKVQSWMGRNQHLA